MTVTRAYNSKALQQPDQEKVAEYLKEFQITAASIKYDIESLREWLTRNPHLPNIDGSYYTRSLSDKQRGDSGDKSRMAFRERKTCINLLLIDEQI